MAAIDSAQLTVNVVADSLYSVFIALIVNVPPVILACAKRFMSDKGFLETVVLTLAI